MVSKKKEVKKYLGELRIEEAVDKRLKEAIREYMSASNPVCYPHEPVDGEIGKIFGVRLILKHTHEGDEEK